MTETGNRWNRKCVTFLSQRQVAALWQSFCSTRIVSVVWKSLQRIHLCFAQNSNLVFYRLGGEGGEVSRGQFATISTTGRCRLNCAAGRWGFGERMSDMANNRDATEVEWCHKMRMRCKTQFEQCWEQREQKVREMEGNVGRGEKPWHAVRIRITLTLWSKVLTEYTTLLHLHWHGIS
jgi:hypothetical protein